MIEKAIEKLIQESSTLEGEQIRLVVEHVLKYVTDDIFALKVLNEKKSVEEMWQYIMSEARKIAVDNSAVMTSDQVFNLAIHYFDEEELSFSKVAGVVKSKNSASTNIEKKKVEKKVQKREVSEAVLLSLDLFGDYGHEEN